MQVNGLSGSATFRVTTDAQPGGDMLGFLRLMQLGGERGGRGEGVRKGGGGEGA